MAITEHARHQLYLRLEEVLGPEEATVLMEHLPPVGWADVATKRDLDGHAAVTKRDLDALAFATKRDIDALAAATKRDIDALAVATKHDIDALSRDFQALAATTKDNLDAMEERLSLRFDARFERELRELEHRFLSRSVLLFGAFFTLQTAALQFLG